VLGEVKRKARRVIWMCPEDPGSWGFGDSEMPLYSRHCTRVEVVKSVDDLGRVAAELMPECGRGGSMLGIPDRGRSQSR